MENNDVRISERVLFLDSNLAVVYKKIGEICESEVKDNTLSLSANVLPELIIKQGSPITYIESVHRIDQPVSGCVLLALDKKTHALLSAQFAENQVHKKYLAVVENKTSMEASAGRLEHLIRFDSKHHKATALAREEIKNFGPEWKKAVLDWKVLGAGERYVFLEIEPLTGRTHQIRAQLSKAGMPIKGDLKYGARRSDPLGGIRLHAWRMQFTHPYSGDTITVTCPIPDPDPLWKACLGYVV